MHMYRYLEDSVLPSLIWWRWIYHGLLFKTWIVVNGNAGSLLRTFCSHSRRQTLTYKQTWSHKHTPQSIGGFWSQGKHQCYPFFEAAPEPKFQQAANINQLRHINRCIGTNQNDTVTVLPVPCWGQQQRPTLLLGSGCFKGMLLLWTEVWYLSVEPYGWVGGPILFSRKT